MDTAELEDLNRPVPEPRGALSVEQPAVYAVAHFWHS